MIDKNYFTEQLKLNGLTLNEEAIKRFEIYADELIEYNKKVNLTAITAPDEICVKHFIDSLMLTKFVDVTGEKKLCDIGTGAGFPGVALLIYNPDLKVTLFDSVNKKLEFIRQLLPKLGLTAQIVNCRAEDAGKDPKFREKFDIATARAVAQLNQLAEYSIPLVSVGGLFCPLKAPLTDEEKQRGFSAAAQLGCKNIRTEKYTVSAENPREIVICEKIRHTDKAFPRPCAKISKNPLG